MSGIVNSTGSKSGVIGTTVGTPSTGDLVQTVTDYHHSGSSISVANSPSAPLGADLEIDITPTSTSNFLLIHCFIPGCSNQGGASALNIGFSYSAGSGSWSAANTLGTKTWVDRSFGYNGTNNSTVSWCTTQWIQAPLASQIKFRPYGQSTNGSVVFYVFANPDSGGQVATLICQEYKV